MCLSLSIYIHIYTLKSLSSLLGDFLREFWRVIFGGVRDYLGEVLGGSYWKSKGIFFIRKNKENYKGKKQKNPANPYQVLLKLLNSKYLADYWAT